MRFDQAAIVVASALLCADVHATPAYDGQTPMIETGPLWFDPALSAEEQASAVQTLLQSQANIVAVYGERLASTRIVWCKTTECATYFAGTDRRPFSTPGHGKPRPGAQYAFSFPAIVVLGPPGRFTGQVLTHEMSHMEFRARLHGVSVPSWFNEGVASYIGGDQDQSCRSGVRGIDNLFDLDSSAQWTAYTFQHRDKARLTYCQARNEAGAWITEHGGFSAVLDLLAGRSKGRSFYSLYGRQQELLSAAVEPAQAQSKDVTN